MVNIDPTPDKKYDDNTYSINFGMLFYVGVNKLLIEISKAAIYGDVLMWYRCLSALYRKISFKLKKEEKEFMMNLLYSVKKKLVLKISNQELRARAQDLLRPDIEEELEYIEVKIMYFLDHYKMILPNYKKTQGWETMVSRYGIQQNKGDDAK